MKFRKGKMCPRCKGKLEEFKPDSKNKKGKQLFVCKKCGWSNF